MRARFACVPVVRSEDAVEARHRAAAGKAAARIDEGVFRIDARLPDKVATGKQLPLQIELVQMNGDVVHANTVYIDIEAAQEVH